MPTPDPENTTPVQRFRAPDALWDAFGRVCKERGIPRARRLIDLMRADINRYGSEQDRDVLREAAMELRQRRSRKPPRRKAA